MIGKQVLAFGKSQKSKFINIGIFAASSGGRKERRIIGSFTPDRERSHVCSKAYDETICHLHCYSLLLTMTSHESTNFCTHFIFLVIRNYVDFSNQASDVCKV